MTDTLTESDQTAPGDPPGDDAGPGAPPPPGSSGTEGSGLARLPARLWARLWAMPPTAWFTLLVVAACVGFVFLQFGPARLLSDTTPTGGDMSAHVWGPAFLRDHLLTKGRLTGWAPDWYAGFPAFQFYMVPPFLAIALLSYVIPYGVAFKLVAVSGCLSLPISFWAFGRLNRLPFPVPAMLSIGATLFLFDRSYAIYGGNIASTLAGEFAYGISLSLAVLYLGVLGYGLRTGKARGWAALLLALAALCHVIPALFVLGATLVWLAVRPSVMALKYLATIGPVALLLTLWWFLPFVFRSGYQNHMGWSKLTDYVTYLFTRQLTDSSVRNYPEHRVMLALAVVGLIVAIAMRQRAVVFLGAAAIGAGLAFVLAPGGESPLWNARILPFYYLLIDALALAGIGLVILAATRLFAAGDRPLEQVMQAVCVGFAGLIIFVYLALPMQALPGGSLDASGTTYTAEYGLPVGPTIRLETKDLSYLRSWAKWNFDGLESYEDKLHTDPQTGEQVMGPEYGRSYPEFHDLIGTLKSIAAERGCGRAMWEYEENHDRFGSTMEPMMLPFFTDGCIGSMEGLYMESSATTPFHFINSTQLSKAGSAPQRELPYATMPPNQADFDQGVAHLQMLGVKYYLAIDDLMKQRAAANTQLEKITDSGPWAIYEVRSSELVASLPVEPAVFTGPDKGTEWLRMSACWYVNQDAWPIPLAADGPESWQRVDRTVNPEGQSAQERCSSPDGSPFGWLTTQPPEMRPLKPVKVSNISAGDDSISFDVDQPGVPVVVRTSYYPNWKVSGGAGPYRVTPNLMVVIPDGNHVELHYGYTGIELLAYALSLVGLVGLVLLFRAEPLAPAPVGPFYGPVEDPERYPRGPDPSAPAGYGPYGYGPYGPPPAGEGYAGPPVPYPEGPPDPVGELAAVAEPGAGRVIGPDDGFPDRGAPPDAAAATAVASATAGAAAVAGDPPEGAPVTEDRDPAGVDGEAATDAGAAGTDAPSDGGTDHVADGGSDSGPGD